MKRISPLISATLTLISISLTLAAQPPAVAEVASSAYVPRQSDRPLPLVGEEPGFRSIFNGESLEGWQGDPTYWRVEPGVLVGEIRPETVIKSNTFIIWTGGKPGNFELKLDYRISAAGNSGINYRSKIVPDTVTPTNAFAMRGYQCDIDGRKRYVGNNYEEKGRLFLAVRGQLTRVVGGRPPVLVAQIGDETELAGVVSDDWNSVHLIVRGNQLTHIVNGRVMSVVIDDDSAHRPVDGQIGVQVHVGPPMKVEYRNIRLKME